MRSVLTIGDCIIDEIRSETGDAQRFPGGAGLNLALGVRKLEMASTLMTRVGQDRDGHYLTHYALRHGVKILKSPTTDPTGVAISSRLNGEPSYSFNSAMYRRRFFFDAPSQDAIAMAAIIAVNSFPLDNAVQTEALAKTLTTSSAIRIVDPNPRPRLIHDIDAYRAGFEKIAKISSIVKISDEDVQVLYGIGWQKIVPILFDFGVQTVLVSLGAGGVRVVEKSGLSVHTPVAVMDSPVIDTMGAGDATLASIITWIVQHGRPESAEQWQACLSQAMAIAAATCRNAGAELTLP